MTPTLQHIIFIDLLPIVLIVGLFLIYRRMEVGLLNDRVKMFSDDATFWREKAWQMQNEWQKLKDEQMGIKSLPYIKGMIYKPDDIKHSRGVLDFPQKSPLSNAAGLPPAGVARLIADLESKDFENILDERPVKEKLTGLDLCAVLFAENLKWGLNGDYFSKGSDPGNGYRLLSDKAKDLAKKHFPNNVKGDWVLFDNNQTINDETIRKTTPETPAE